MINNYSDLKKGHISLYALFFAVMKKSVVFFCTLLVFSVGGLFSQENNLNSLCQAVKTAKEDTNKVRSLTTISNDFLSTNEYDKSIDYAKQALTIALKLNYKKGEAAALNIIGANYERKSDYPKALDYFLKALKIREEIGDKKGIGACYTNIGGVYRNIANYPKALEYHFKSLKIKEDLGDKKSTRFCYLNIGIVYYEQSNYPKALGYFFKSLKISEELGDKYGEAICYNDIGNVYIEQSNYQKAFECYLKSLQINKQIGNKQVLESCYTNIGELCNKFADYKKAIQYLDSSLQISKQIGDINGERMVYGHLAEAYSKTGNYKAAYETHVKYKQLTDSIFNAENSKQLGDLKTNFEVEKKETELKAEQEKKDIITAAEKKRQTIILFLGSCVFLLVVLFSALLYKRFRLTNQQKEIIEHKQKEITDSINYAKRLQTAILPPESYWQKYLPESFVLYQPKDIVSGDFYWLETINDLILFAASDCTGHGVSGAMVSIVCSNALNRTVKEFGITDPAKILDKTRELVLETFAKSENEVKDGMDISLCSLNSKTNELLWSGANNPLLYISENNFYEIKPNKQPIGKTDYPKPFTTHKVRLKKEDTIYIFTDGYPDQFGGDKGKKFKYKQFEEILFSIHTKPMEEQKNILEKTFETWKGDLEQTDDVLIIGIKI